ncbi:Alanyl-tRNA synthetase [Prochlorococcus marinus subsp. pastoris str. CCMP1986]|uniref:Alanine--tRNA ligase n=1 Tax=Prochlorococcus marinus subsp. pastoris (strain CCMP1986 / NIES-2087 / MED4) TaxID=59919 RepID=SYA_PROMP|nr:alanine--tRNA ligase [Prochlorococcus marinus]Q7V3N0.1 RecName: Full=Alanine--tRNA ligase; AltName: Full=Alanyl-tRNA synthetase; Short=AlaRS [Prochlorococcus marinus subsp. pastoris str. CCMP1986]KGF88208.1 Alanyl-tRNA synthetase [Prochlorococcus marinus str. EQPAC1]CAE18503.1 Alanyl-tRNA synthetase [Prochlorococcus marinus subsp. pastoris str. CCMP1986]
MKSQTKNTPITGDEIRKEFLNFYHEKLHKIIPSASLIPDDPTVMLTIAGMLPFKPVFLGLKERPSKRATSSQKCIRTNDIENVGVTARHHTFFEMLGNFSFGDYFKKEAIEWAWELVTDIYGLSAENIIVSVFHEDDDSVKIWKEDIGIHPKRIIKLGEKDNFWSSGKTGPCGPCSELYFDFKPEKGVQNIDLEDGDRFIEFYNLVFMQYNRDPDGQLTDLKYKNIDTGMGLERMAQILQKKKNNYETDLIFPIIQKASEISKIDYYSSGERTKISLKIIGDHIRAVIHLISDGVIASNLGRGYILRRLIRRMVRHGRLLGLKNEFLSKLASVGIKLMQENYPDLKNNCDHILSEIKIEEIRFRETLERGEKLLDELISSGQKMITGFKAFELYDTYGFPLELTEEIAQENNIGVDVKGFDKEMSAQKERAKAASQIIDLTLEGSLEREIDLFDKTLFNGYDSLDSDAEIKGIFLESTLVKQASEGQKVLIVLDQTSFYGESGGQVGDIGTILSNDLEVVVDNVIRKKNVFLHYGIVKKGILSLGQKVKTKVNDLARAKAAANHTATHLLQSALKVVVNESVGQKGSLVAFNKLRFDFNSSKPITKDQIFKVETLVNSWILENHSLNIKNMAKSEALERGAVAMFGEKYDDEVRVVDVPSVSMELCGGTHVKTTSELGCFKIISEEGISAGVRRIEALSGQSAFEYFSDKNSLVSQLCDLLKANPNQLLDRVNSLQSELINKNKEIQKMKDEIAYFKYSSLSSSANKVGLFSLIISQLDGLDGNSLQSAALDLTSKLGDKSVVILGGIPDKENRKLLFVVSFGEDLVKRGMHAGKLINDISRICSGGGGGKPNFAQAGAKDIDKLNDALEYARKDLRTKLHSYSDK